MHYINVKARTEVSPQGERGDICDAPLSLSLWENNRLLREYDVHLQSENSLKMSLTIARARAQGGGSSCGAAASRRGASRDDDGYK